MIDLIDRQAALDAIKSSELGREYDEVEKVQIFNPWHRVDELPKEEGRYWIAVWFAGHWIFDAAWYTHDISTVIDVPCCERVGGFYRGNTEVHPDYWMPIEPPKEGNNGSSRKEAGSDL